MIILLICSESKECEKNKILKGTHYDEKLTLKRV